MEKSDYGGYTSDAVWPHWGRREAEMTMWRFSEGVALISPAGPDPGGLDLCRGRMLRIELPGRRSGCRQDM